MEVPAFFRLNMLQKVLLSIIGVILVAVVFVTAWAFKAQPQKIGAGLRHADPSPVSVEKKASSEMAVYSEIGRLRAITADVPPVSLIVTPFFTYPTEDTAFFEELVQKKLQIRSLLLEYFAVHDKAELLRMGEAAVKQELLVRINSALMLGNIDALYFNEYIFLN